jgi:hypothetical protein
MAEYDWTADPVVQPGGQAPAAPGYDFQADPVMSPPGNRPPGAINAAGDTVDPVTGRLRIRVTPRNQPDQNLLPKVEGEDYQPAGPPQEPMGALPALGVGAVQGATANFGDEALGALAAGTAGLPLGGEAVTRAVAQAMPTLGLPLQAGAGLARMIHENLAGRTSGEQPKGPATSAYEQARDRWRATVERAQTQRPYSYGGGQFGGAVASMPYGGWARGVPLSVNAVRTGMTAATQGLVAGAGEGETLEDRAQHGGTGLIVGGALGTAATPVIHGATWLASKATEPIRSRVAAIFKPTAEAERKVAESIAAGKAVDPNATARLTEQEFNAAKAAGEPVRLMDLGGEDTRALARSAANLSPQARSTLEQSISPTFQHQSNRFTDWISRQFNYSNEQARQRAISHVQNTIIEPRYAKAWKDSRNIELWDDTLADLAQAPEIQSAIRVATANFRNWAVLDGTRPPLPAFKIADGRTALMESKSGASNRLPSLQYWDYIKRALDQSGDPTAASFARALRNHLDTLVPAYKAARESAQPTKFFQGASNAYEAGQSFLNRGQQFGPQAQREIGRMTPEERKLFSDGYFQKMYDIIDKHPNRLDVLTRINASEGAKKEAMAALGPQRFKELEAKVRLEDLIDRPREAIKGNSTTARQIIEYTLAGGGGAYGLYTGDPHAIGASALLAGHRAINTRMARKIAELLVSEDPKAISRAVMLAARDNRIMENLRKLGINSISKGAPPQTTGVLGPTTSRVSSGEEVQDQPVPGPPK